MSDPEFKVALIGYGPVGAVKPSALSDPFFLLRPNHCVLGAARSLQKLNALASAV